MYYDLNMPVRERYIRTLLFVILLCAYIVVHTWLRIACINRLARTREFVAVYVFAFGMIRSIITVPTTRPDGQAHAQLTQLAGAGAAGAA
jgi:hypothetical protein